ncbi:MAG: methionine--tRNA ligase subunit beta [Candidatus Omnitrophota bacterium]
MITFAEFKKLDLRIARVKEVKDHPNADKLYILIVDLGSETKELVAGLKPMYTPEQLLGKQVVVVNNLEPATIRGAVSSGMVLAAKDKGSLTVLTTDKEVELGSPVS